MFKNGLKQPLLAWLKKEAGKDYIEPAFINTNEFPKILDLRFRYAYVKHFRITIEFSRCVIFQLCKEPQDFTRDRFRKALRKLKKAGT